MRRDGTAHSRFLAAWETTAGPAWSLCLLLVACCPPLRSWGLAASLDENPACGQRCWQHPTTAPFPSLQTPLFHPSDFISTDVNLGHGNFTRHGEDKHLSRGTVCAEAQRRDNRVASLEKGMPALWLKQEAPAQQGVDDDMAG